MPKTKSTPDLLSELREFIAANAGSLLVRVIRRLDDPPGRGDHEFLLAESTKDMSARPNHLGVVGVWLTYKKHSNAVERISPPGMRGFRVANPVGIFEVAIKI
jgi:hypothetical protein